MDVKIYKSVADNIEMKVTKDNSGQVIKVEHANGNLKVETGTLIDLKLSYDQTKKRFAIDSIPDNTTIEAHASPGCFWYFWNGSWWRICT